mgnify:CR=1 FL=1
MTTRPDSSGCRKAWSTALPNSAASSRKSTPWCAWDSAPEPFMGPLVSERAAASALDRAAALVARGAREAATAAEAVRASDLVVDRGHVSVAWLEGAGATGWGDWPLALPNGDGFGIVDRVAVSAAQVTAWSQQLDELVSDDARDPLSPGVAVAGLARDLGTSPAVVHLLAAASGLDVDAGRVRGAEHRRGDRKAHV